MNSILSCAYFRFIKFIFFYLSTFIVYIFLLYIVLHISAYRLCQENKNPPYLHLAVKVWGSWCHGGSLAQAAATQNLVELGCYKLKKVYALCENFIYTGPLPVLSPGWGSVPGLAGLAGLLGLLGLAGLAGLAVIHDSTPPPMRRAPARLWALEICR